MYVLYVIVISCACQCDSIKKLDDDDDDDDDGDDDAIALPWREQAMAGRTSLQTASNAHGLCLDHVVGVSCLYVYGPRCLIQIE